MIFASFYFENGKTGTKILRQRTTWPDDLKSRICAIKQIKNSLEKNFMRKKQKQNNNKSLYAFQRYSHPGLNTKYFFVTGTETVC
jgi:hypothetical protein